MLIISGDTQVAPTGKGSAKHKIFFTLYRLSARFRSLSEPKAQEAESETQTRLYATELKQSVSFGA